MLINLKDIVTVFNVGMIIGNYVITFKRVIILSLVKTDGHGQVGCCTVF